MEELKRYFIVLCSMALLFPAILSLVHISAHQEEVACTNFSDTHFHKKSLECELCDSRLTSLFTYTPVANPIIETAAAGSEFYFTYQFLSDHQKLSFELRGPPIFA